MVPTFRVDDLVMFKSKGAHRERGLVYPTDNVAAVAVLCMDGTLLYEDEANLTVVDRSNLQPGSIVVSASDPGGQIGVVTEAATTLDLVQLDGGGSEPTVVARGVSPADLRQVGEFCRSDYVVSGPWLGQVTEVCHDVDVRFDDGAMCRVADADSKLSISYYFADADSMLSINYYSPWMKNDFFPGQRVRCLNPSAFKDSRWINGKHWKSSHVEGTVTKVEQAAVLVSWVASAELGNKPDLIRAAAPPALQQNPQEKLTFFAHAKPWCWAFGDRCYFRTDDGSKTTSSSSSVTATAAGDGHEPEPTSSACGHKPSHRIWKTLSWQRRSRRARQRKNKLRRMRPERPMSVADTRTTANVLWQDGTRQHDVPTASLVPFELLNNKEFFPGQRVVFSKKSVYDNGAGGVQDSVSTEKKQDGDTAVGHTDTDAGSDNGAAAGPAARYGIVRSFDIRNQTVRVSWLKTAEHGGCMVEEEEETVSAYDLDDDTDHRVLYGDVVIRQRSLESACDKEAAGDLSWVGHVVDLCDGLVQVNWGDGTSSKVLPHEISVVDDESFLEVVDWEISLHQWIAHDAVDEAQEDAVEDQAAAAAAVPGGNEDNGVDDSAPGKRFLMRDPEAMPSSAELATVMENAVKMSNGGDGSQTSAAAVVEKEDDDDDIADGNVYAEKENAGAASVDRRGNDPFPFLRFDVVQQSPEDHFFLKDTEQGMNGGRKWIKRVQKEWKILEKDLPDTIFVQVFEDRMDLLRVAMVGAVGTPYQDGLFFFDLHLPPTYPNVPPQVHYHSFGLRVNPNLDESGTVCLSLLGTFDGEGVELWSPATSSVLQVAVSIQGLVLTAQPFHNESSFAPHFGTPQEARNSVVFTENACLLTLRTTLHLLRRPPAGFGDLVRGHFRRRGRFVLQACKTYLREGCHVGMLDADAAVTEVNGDEQQLTCSAGFRLTLARIVPHLVDAFVAIGAGECAQFNR